MKAPSSPAAGNVMAQAPTAFLVSGTTLLSQLTVGSCPYGPEIRPTDTEAENRGVNRRGSLAANRSAASAGSKL